jgi:hypothetical protein
VAHYTVVWTSVVENDFIDVWLAADSPTRQQLTAIANTIDQGLTKSPVSLGKPVAADPTIRVWVLPQFQSSVSVDFEILPADRIVRVLRITIAKN